MQFSSSGVDGSAPGVDSPDGTGDAGPVPTRGTQSVAGSARCGPLDVEEPHTSAEDATCSEGERCCDNVVDDNDIDGSRPHCARLLHLKYNFEQFSPDRNLEHTIVVSNKVSKAIGVLNKIRYILPVSVLSILYCTLILPYYQYCNIV